MSNNNEEYLDLYDEVESEEELEKRLIKEAKEKLISEHISLDLKDHKQ